VVKEVRKTSADDMAAGAILPFSSFRLLTAAFNGEFPGGFTVYAPGDIFLVEN
jgi:hypothetical protein